MTVRRPFASRVVEIEDGQGQHFANAQQNTLESATVFGLRKTMALIFLLL